MPKSDQLEHELLVSAEPLRLVASSAPPHVEVHLASYSWPKCKRCHASGRFFDAGYLMRFLLDHRGCEEDPMPKSDEFGHAPPIRKNRYCGSKFRHKPHEKPMIGNPQVVFVCRGLAPDA